MAQDISTMSRDDAEELGVLGAWYASRRDPAKRARVEARWERAGEQRTDGRKGGAIASTLNPEALLAAGRAAYAAEHPGADVAALVEHGPLPQMTFTADGDLVAVVNGEGVGAVSTDGTAVDVWFDIGGMWGTLPIRLSVIAEATERETIDLADGIRHFGARLDSNHYGWRDRYTS